MKPDVLILSVSLSIDLNLKKSKEIDAAPLLNINNYVHVVSNILINIIMRRFNLGTIWIQMDPNDDATDGAR